MKRFISTLILAICSQILCAKDLAYLNGMPTVEAVRKEVSADNPLHTYTKQAGALFRLKLWIINGDFNGYSTKAAPQEQVLIDKYDNATGELRQEYIGKYGGMSAQQQKEWTRLVGDYAYDDGVKDILITRLLSPDTRKAYEAWHGYYVAKANERSAAIRRGWSIDASNAFAKWGRRMVSLCILLFGCYLFSRTNEKLRGLAKERFNNGNAFPTFEDAEVHQRDRVMNEYAHLASWVVILIGISATILTWAVQ